MMWSYVLRCSLSQSELLEELLASVALHAWATPPFTHLCQQVRGGPQGRVAPSHLLAPRHLLQPLLLQQGARGQAA